MKAPRYSNGIGLLDVVIGAGLLSALLVGATALVQMYGGTTGKVVRIGEVEDLRRYLRERLDCEVTVTQEKPTCDAGGNIRGYTSAAVPIIADTEHGLTLNQYAIRLPCKTGPQSIELAPQYRNLRNGEEGWKALFTVPFECGFLAASPSPSPSASPTPTPVACALDSIIPHASIASLARRAYTRPRGFDPANAPPTVRINDPFAWRAVQRLCAQVAGGPLVPQNPSGAVHNDANSGDRLCECLGYQTVVARSCNQPYGYGDGCGYSSPQDDTMGYWRLLNGVWRWVIRPAVLSNVWIGTMTCGSPKCR